MACWVVPGVLIVATWTLLGEVGAELILAALAGMIFVACVSYGIDVRAGYAVDRCRYSGSVGLPVVMNLIAELVELLDALAVGAKGALGSRGPELEKSQDKHDGYHG